MPKPTVPTGPIAFEGQPPAVRLGSLRNQLRSLASSPLLQQIEEALAAEDWRKAVTLLAVITESIGGASAEAVRLTARINRKRYSPLMEALGDG